MYLLIYLTDITVAYSEFESIEKMNDFIKMIEDIDCKVLRKYKIEKEID